MEGRDKSSRNHRPPHPPNPRHPPEMSQVQRENSSREDYETFRNYFDSNVMFKWNCACLDP